MTGGLPPIPADIERGLQYRTPAPEPGPKTEAEVADLIAQLRLSEEEKIRAGRRLMSIYSNLDALLRNPYSVEELKHMLTLSEAEFAAALRQAVPQGD